MLAITQEIGDMEYISPEIAQKVLEDFHKLFVTQEYLSQGGPEYAQKLLIKAFGAEGAKELLVEVRRAQEATSESLDTLQKTDPQQLAKFMQGEHPQTIALILAHLQAKSARFSSDGVAGAIARTSREATGADAAIFARNGEKNCVGASQEAHPTGTTEPQGIRRGKSRCGPFEPMDQLSSGTILDTIEQDDTLLATSIRNLMFTFEDFLEIPEPGMRELLGQVDKKTLSIALKSASEDLRNHFFQEHVIAGSGNVEGRHGSTRAMRARDVAAAQQEIVTVARRLETEGKMVLKAEEEESYVV